MMPPAVAVGPSSERAEPGQVAALNMNPDQGNLYPKVMPAETKRTHHGLMSKGQGVGAGPYGVSISPSERITILGFTLDNKLGLPEGAG